ncbi:MAG: hypothetical protein Q9M37_08210 [Desulfonauticus sp.]|nr:hypothetical protein [Desulfonauticus sp.]
MIIVDGREIDLKIKNFSNLEDLLVKVMESEGLKDRIVTDVYVNEEVFSELYPNEAADIEVDEIERVEIKTESIEKMATEIVKELGKVLKLLVKSGEEIANLFREAKDFEALDMYQDFLEVLRDFIGMISVLYQDCGFKETKELDDAVKVMSELFSELIDIQEKEDWILLADVIEYELLPHLKDWDNILKQLNKKG